MLRHCLISLEDHKRSEDTTADTRVISVKNLMSERRMKWDGHSGCQNINEGTRRVP